MGLLEGWGHGQLCSEESKEGAVGSRDGWVDAGWWLVGMELRR